jgi:hypothetical protein
MSQCGSICVWLSVCVCLCVCVSVCVCAYELVYDFFMSPLSSNMWGMVSRLGCDNMKGGNPGWRQETLCSPLSAPAPQSPSLSEVWAPPSVLQTGASLWIFKDMAPMPGGWLGAQSGLGPVPWVSCMCTSHWMLMSSTQNHNISCVTEASQTLLELTIELETDLLSMHLTDMKTCVHCEYYTRMFVVTGSEWSSEALFSFATNWVTHNDVSEIPGNL